MKIQGSVALVTGANRGLGRALVLALQAAGAKKIYGGARNPQTVTIPGVVPVKLDVTSADDIEAAAQALGDVTVLFNNAGIFRNYDLSGENSGDVVRESFETNVFGLLAVSRAFAPVLGRNGGGAIANMLSVMAWLALPGTMVYSASKAAGLLITEGLRAELGGQGTQVTAIHAGYIDTEMVAGVQAPKIDPKTVAQRIVEGVNNGAQEILVDEISAQVKTTLSAPKPAFGR